MRVVILPAALTDIERIGEFVAQDAPSAAAALIQDLLARCDALASFPQRGAIVGRAAGRDVRRLVHLNYLIVYTVEDKSVFVRRVVHDARSPRALLRDLDPTP